MRWLLVAAAVGLALGCADLGAQADRGWPASQDGLITQAGGYVEVAGTGKPDPKSQGETQRRSTSRDAAILDARDRLLTYLKRIMIAPGVSVGERASEDKGWSARLERAAAGIEVAQTKWEDDDTAAVVLRVEKAAVRRALGLDEQ